MRNIITTLAAMCWLVGTAQAGQFTPCVDGDSAPALQGSLCARVAVPLAYDGSAAKAELFIRKFPAAHPVGSVWLAAGGPGESGASLYALVEVLRRAFPGYDLLLPDHRGTGFSSRLCPAEEALDSAGGVALAGAEWGSCFGRLTGQPALAAPFTLSNGARDLRFLVEHGDDDGDGPVYLYGVSYGTQLVLRALQMGPLRARRAGVPVRGVILDSLVPLATDARFDLSQRSAVVDASGRQLLHDCDGDAACRSMLGEPADAVLRRVLARGAADPVLLAAIPGRNLKRWLGGALDVPAARALVPRLIKQLDQGVDQTTEGAALPRMQAALARAGASLGEFAQAPPSIPLVSIISAAENNLRPQLTMAQLRHEEESLLFSSRLPELLVAPALPVYARDQWFGAPFQPGSLPPLLVLSGTRDPKTPYAGAQAHVTALRRAGDVRAIAVKGAPHFILWTAPACFIGATRDFLNGKVTGDANCDATTPFN